MTPEPAIFMPLRAVAPLPTVTAPVARSVVAVPMAEPTCIRPSANFGAAFLARWIGSTAKAIAPPAVPTDSSNGPNALCNATAPPSMAVNAIVPCWIDAGRDENESTSVSNP